MGHVFISYSRRDAEFVAWLAGQLREEGKEVWVDVEGIRDAELFPDALRRAIEGADAFVFVISPDSVASEFCELEVRHAATLNKRIVPLSLREVNDEQVPDDIRFRNWIPSPGGLPDVRRVLAAIDTDLEWDQQHTRLSVKALEWDGGGRDRSLLLRGTDLGSAERWLAESAGKVPGPTSLEQEYVFAGRGAATRRQRRIVGSASSVAVVAVGLLIFALISRSQAVTAETRARAQALAAQSLGQQDVNPERSILLARAAVGDGVTYGPQGTMFALRAALDASPLRMRFPDAGSAQTCGPTGAGSTPIQVISGPGIAVRPGGGQLAEGLCNGRIRLIDPATGRVRRTITLPGQAFQIGYAPDGSTLVAAAGRPDAETLYAIDPASGRITRGPDVVANSELAFVAHTSTVAFLGAAHTGASPGLVEWTVGTGAARVLQPSTTLPPGYAPFALAISPDGRQLLVGGNQSANGEQTPGVLRFTLPDTNVEAVSLTSATAFAYSSDGKVLAVGSETSDGAGEVAIWNQNSLKPQRTLVSLPFNPITALTFSGDGKRLAFGTVRGRGGVLDVASGRTVVSLPGPRAIMSSVAFSPDGQLVYTGSADGSMLGWRATGLELSAAPISGTTNAGVVGDPGGYVTLGQSPSVTAQRWRADGTALDAPLVISPTSQVNAEFLSPDGRLAGVIPYPNNDPNAAEGPIQLWDVAARRVAVTVPSGPLPSGAEPALSPDGRVVILAVGKKAGSGAQLMLVDTRTGRRSRIDSTSCPSGYDLYSFNTSGTRVAAGTQCGDVAAYDVATGRSFGKLEVGGSVADVAVSPNGRELAAASYDGTVTLVDVDTGKAVARLTENTAAAVAVVFSPDGRYLASGGSDRTVRVFSARSHAELRVIPQPAEVGTINFMPDSTQILTLDSDRVVRRWDACTDCQDKQALLALAATRVTRELTPAERREFGVD